MSGINQKIFLQTWTTQTIGRRWSAVASLATFAIMMLISIPFIDNELLITIFGMVGRFFAIYSIDTAFQLRLLKLFYVKTFFGYFSRIAIIPFQKKYRNDV